ncbi:hypothetical protein SAMN04488056_1176 [Cohaesibacter marisflavi]|uniref:Uncharacterized protein n=1 Tax=Cohaesibacter marisflavi TaxID=655353 RepID=A0A1I5LJG9_9HYPH|nr:hypothetical protein [Cohaesibacter marisflavi]SFO96891.1 hypothetical protein SAMN04488056_1176 [Cohaesibacter marisflavi]
MSSPKRMSSNPENVQAATGTKSSRTSETGVYLKRLCVARTKAALLIADGEDWILPHFERLNAEVNRVEAKKDVLDLAIEIALKAKQMKSD